MQKFNNPMRHSLHLFACLGAALLTLAVAASAHGQVTLSPTFLYVESPASYGTVMVTNSTENVQEVFVHFEFGYPAVDENGHRYLEYDDADSEAAFSLSPWVRSFPERIRIAPKHRQMVRLMINTPRDFEKGIYWTRMVVTSREEHDPVAGGAGAVVDFEFKQVISVVFDHGARSTSVEIDDLIVDSRPRQVNLMTVLERTGDEPFFGSIGLRLLDDAGREVARTSTTTEVYFRSSTYFTIDRGDVPAGHYAAEVTVRPERSDVRTGDVPEMAPLVRRFAIEIPEPGPLTYEAQ